MRVNLNIDKEARSAVIVDCKICLWRGQWVVRIYFQKDDSPLHDPLVVARGGMSHPVVLHGPTLDMGKRVEEVVRDHPHRLVTPKQLPFLPGIGDQPLHHVTQKLGVTPGLHQ